MRRVPIPTALAIIALAALACSGPGSPLSAQLGSSVVIPVAGTATTLPTIGYGSAMYSDLQRGSLVFFLRRTGFADIEIHPRLTSAFAPLTSAPMGYGQEWIAPQQVASLIDLPDGQGIAPGVYEIDVVRRHFSGGVWVDEPIPYAGQINLLPAALDSDCDGTDDTFGTPTPFQAFAGPVPFDISAYVDLVVPRPRLGIELDKWVHALEVDVTYPTSVINVRSVGERGGQGLASRALAWFGEPTPGSLRIGLMGVDQFKGVDITYELDGTQPLDPDQQVTITIRSATDANGVPLSPPPVVVSKVIQ